MCGLKSDAEYLFSQRTYSGIVTQKRTQAGFQRRTSDAAFIQRKKLKKIRVCGIIQLIKQGKRGYYHKRAGPVVRKLSNISWNLLTVVLEKSVNLC